MFGIFAMCLFGSIFTFFKFFTLRGCFEGIRDCFKPKDGGYKVRFSELIGQFYTIILIGQFENL